MVCGEMVLALGILIGLVVSALILLSVAHFRPAIERAVNQTASKLKQKGSILEPEDVQLEDWINTLPK